MSLATEVEEHTALVSATLDNSSVAEVLLEGDILRFAKTILRAGATIQREEFLRAIAAELGEPLNRKLRSILNGMISQEVRAGKLNVDASWLFVSRPR